MARFDRVIRGGMVVDGSRLPRFRGDIGIKDGMIAEIGQIGAGEADEMIDAGGLIVAPGWATLWIVLLGLGTGGGIILGLTFVGLRASHAQQAAALSGMAQCVGYLFAASGPALVGAMHDRLGGWTAALGLCAALCVAMAGCGLLAGRAIQIGQFRTPPAKAVPRAPR